MRSARCLQLVLTTGRALDGSPAFRASPASLTGPSSSTALENVQLLAEVTGGDAETRSRGALERVNLDDVSHRFPPRVVGRAAAASGDRPGAGEGAAAVVV